MVLRLGALGFLHYEKYGVIRLSKKGVDFGKYLLKRHSIIEAFLKFIGTDNPLLETELLEHSASPETINNIETLLLFFSKDLSALNGYMDFRHALAGGSHP
jgi:Mn-dependent DtxR family transcriptional regulator